MKYKFVRQISFKLENLYTYIVKNYLNWGGWVYRIDVTYPYPFLKQHTDIRKFRIEDSLSLGAEDYILEAMHMKHYLTKKIDLCNYRIIF